MNKIILMGNLSRDPEMTVSASGKGVTVTKFDLAVHRKGVKDGEVNVDFFHCTSFGKQAEFVNKYFKKGSRMMIIGRVHNNNYTNKDGDKVYGFNVLVEDVEFGRNRSKEDSSEE